MEVKKIDLIMFLLSQMKGIQLKKNQVPGKKIAKGWISKSPKTKEQSLTALLFL